MEKNDLRVIKTKNILYSTLLELMKEKQFEEIKVSDICSHALINRSTFYSHYNDKYELLEEYINTLKDSLIEELSKNKNINNTKQYYIELIKLFFNHIDEKRNIYISAMINNRNSITMDIIYDVLNHEVTKRLNDIEFKNKTIPVEIISKFYLGAVFNVGIEWLKNENKYSKEDLVNYLDKLIPDNL